MFLNNLRYAYYLCCQRDSDCSQFVSGQEEIFKKLCESKCWDILYQDTNTYSRFHLNLLLRKIEPCSTLVISHLHDLGCTPREIVKVLRQLYELHIWLLIGLEIADIYDLIEYIEDHYSDVMDEHISVNDEFFRRENNEFCIF